MGPSFRPKDEHRLSFFAMWVPWEGFSRGGQDGLSCHHVGSRGQGWGDLRCQRGSGSGQMLLRFLVTPGGSRHLGPGVAISPPMAALLPPAGDSGEFPFPYLELDSVTRLDLGF